MISEQENNLLKLENQICFSLYSASKSFTKIYQPVLEPLGLTYPQYLVMLILWENNNISVKEIGNLLNLDSGTLTPLLKRLESQKLVSRIRSKDDERVVKISLTEQGLNLKHKAKDVPMEIFKKSNLDLKKLKKLKVLLDDVIGTLNHP